MSRFPLIPARFPLPPSHALCCPVCGVYKMHPWKLDDAAGFLCLGTDCRHFISRIEAESFVGLEMVEE